MSKAMDTLEMLEEKIENFKWLIATTFSPKRSGLPGNINLIKKSSGILNKTSPKGTAFENKIRGGWNTNFLKRIS